MVIQKRGFTLLELMIVVIIVGILASLAMPRFANAIERAKWIGCVQTLGSIRRAAELYYVEYGQYPGLYYLNGSNKDCPESLDIGIPDPDADGRYGYCTIGPPQLASAFIFGFLDKGGSPAFSTQVRIYYDGHFESYFGAPEF